MKIATWVSDLTEKVCKEHSIEVPILEARRIASGYSGLTTSEGDKRKIIIRYSSKTPMWQKKMVLLHELAHCMMPLKEHHSEAFWNQAFELYKENKLPIRKVMQNERGYRRTAENAYRAVQGLKVKKTVKRKISIDTHLKLKDTSWNNPIIGIKIGRYRQAWAVISMQDNGSWRGYKITMHLYKKLAEKQIYNVLS